MAQAQLIASVPQLVLDDDSDHEIIDRTTALPPVEGLIRPVAMKVKAQVVGATKPMVARPIPKRATEKFYDEAYRQGIPQYAVNAAIMESHDWHRKWTTQDEECHTTSNNQTSPAGALPQGYAYQSPELPNMVLDRMAGARNPSPEWEGESESPIVSAAERKRGRFEATEQPTASEEAALGPPLLQILWDGQKNGHPTPSPLDGGSQSEQTPQSEEESACMLVAPAAKRPVPIRPAAPTLDDDDDEDDHDLVVDEPQEPPAKLLVRPVALRVPRPVIAQLPATGISSIPKFVSSEDASCSKMSAITQGSGLSKNSKSDHGFDFHTDAPRVQAMMVEDEQDTLEGPVSANMSLEESLVVRRDALLQALAVSGGDAQSATFAETVDPLSEVFEGLNLDTREVSEDADDNGQSVHGTWLTLTKPTFFGNLGENDAGDPMYTLGRMTFDMFSPTNLVCSLQGNFNSIEIVGDEQRGEMLKAGLVPKRLREEVENRDVVLRTYK